MSELILYRGDFEKIKKFDTTKASKWSLVGQGIYLTDSLRIAQSYRTKGSYSAADDLIYSGKHKNKGEAMEKAFISFVEMKLQEDGIKSKNIANDSRFSKWRDKYLFMWEESLRKGDIEITSTKDYIRTDGRAGVSYTGLIRYEFKKDLTIGRITKFSFDNASNKFNNSVFNVSAPCTESFVLQHLYNRGVRFGFQGSCDEFVNKYHRTILGPAGRSSNPPLHGTQFNNVIPMFKELGYIGFEYNGGVLIGGYGTHRAFSIWDDEFVNEHKIGVIR
ncbi:hypothetical protein [Ralstonia phage RP13]|nr:hypothetical protein [Ralstonia phage RP13]